MKKFLALLLALTMVLAMAACGNNSTPRDRRDGSSYGKLRSRRRNRSAFRCPHCTGSDW